MLPESEKFKNIKIERTDDPEKLLLSADCKVDLPRFGEVFRAWISSL